MGCGSSSLAPAPGSSRPSQQHDPAMTAVFISQPSNGSMNISTNSSLSADRGRSSMATENPTKFLEKPGQPGALQPPKALEQNNHTNHEAPQFITSTAQNTVLLSTSGYSNPVSSEPSKVKKIAHHQPSLSLSKDLPEPLVGRGSVEETYDFQQLSADLHRQAAERRVSQAQPTEEFQLAIIPDSPRQSNIMGTPIINAMLNDGSELNLSKLSSSSSSNPSPLVVENNRAAANAAALKRTITLKLGSSRQTSAASSPAPSRPGSGKKPVKLVLTNSRATAPPSVSPPSEPAALPAASENNKLSHDLLLTCRNCEHEDVPVHSWCVECFSSSKGAELRESDLSIEQVPVLCSGCELELHLFAKSASHTRASFKIPAVPSDSAYSPGVSLKALQCSNCRSDAPSIWCSDCRAIFCPACSNNIHSQETKHNRAIFKSKFIHADSPGIFAQSGEFDWKSQAATKKLSSPPSSAVSAAAAAAVARATARASMGIAKAIAMQHGGAFKTFMKPPIVTEIKENVEEVKAQPPVVEERKVEESKSAEPIVEVSQQPITVPAVVAPPLQRAPSKVSSPRRSLISTAPPAPEAPKENPAKPQPPALEIPEKTVTFPSATAKTPGSGGLSSPRSGAANSIIRTTSHNSPRTVPQASLNPGESGDVLMVRGQLDIHQAIQLDQLQFKNLYNLFDTLGMVQIVSVVCGLHHAAAVSNYGSLFTFGSNAEHQLGYETPGENHTNTPQLVRFPSEYGPTPIASVSCGYYHTLALDQSGRVYSWGHGLMGVLGTNSEKDQILPQRLEIDEPIGAIVAGAHNSGAITKSGTAYFAWGEGSAGCIGDNQLTPHLVPVRVSIHEFERDPLVCLSFGTQHAAAVTRSGAVFTWGNNRFGQLGIPKDVEILPVPKKLKSHEILGLESRTVHCGERHTSLVTKNGELYSFGSGETHQLGILDNVDQFTPVKANELTRIRTASVGSAISVVVNSLGELHAFGYGLDTAIPTRLNALKGHYFQSAAIGANEMCVLLTGNTRDLFEWNFNGSPLDHTAEDHPEPHSHGHPILNSTMRGKRIVQLAAGKDHYGAVTIDGKLYMWGSNGEFQLGLGAAMNKIGFLPFPRHVHIKAAITEVRCAVHHTVALTSDQMVYSWGTNEQGRLGLGEGIAEIFEPTVIKTFQKNLVKIRSIAVGETNSAFIDINGKLYICGGNTHGQCGDHEGLPHFEPYLVHSLPRKARTISFGHAHVAVLCEQDEVFVFGDNRFHQCGLGLTEYDDEEYLFTPTLMKTLKSFPCKPIQVECGDNIVLILMADGSIYGCGQAETHQLCRGPIDYDNPEYHEDIHIPTKLVFPFDEKIISITVRDINCALMTEKKAVWLWGWEFNEPTRVAIPANSNPAAQPNTAEGRFLWDSVVIGHSRMLLLQSEARVSANKTTLSAVPGTKSGKETAAPSRTSSKLGLSSGSSSVKKKAAANATANSGVLSGKPKKK